MIPYAVDAYLWRAVQNAALLEWRHRRTPKRDRRREQRLQKETRPAPEWVSVETPEQLALYRDQVRHLCQQWGDLFPRGDRSRPLPHPSPRLHPGRGRRPSGALPGGLQGPTAPGPVEVAGDGGVRGLSGNSLATGTGPESPHSG